MAFSRSLSTAARWESGPGGPARGTRRAEPLQHFGRGPVALGERLPRGLGRVDAPLAGVQPGHRGIDVVATQLGKDHRVAIPHRPGGHREQHLAVAPDVDVVVDDEDVLDAVVHRERPHDRLAGISGAGVAQLQVGMEAAGAGERHVDVLQRRHAALHVLVERCPRWRGCPSPGGPSNPPESYASVRRRDG